MKKKKHIKKQSQLSRNNREGVITNKKVLYTLGFLIAIFGFFLYANTLQHGYVLDDYSVIKDNWLVKRGLDGISTIFSTSYRYGYWSSQGTLYRPLSLVMFATEWHFFPDNPSVSHFINVLLYAITGLVLFFTLSKILNKYNIIIPFICSLLFIAHPVHTEVVANIKSRDEILSFLFILLALNLLWKYFQTKSVKSLIMSLACYFLAFLSKESAITMLAAIPLMIFLFTDISLKKNLKITGYFVIIAIVYLIIRQSVLGDVKSVSDVSVVDNLLAAAPDIFTRTATTMYIMGRYFILLIFPHPLVSDYSYNQIPIVNWADFRPLLSLLLYIGLCIYSLIIIKKKKIIAFAILFFLITISLYSNIFITIGSSFGERFLYVPSLGFCLLIAFLIVKLMKVDSSSSGGIPDLSFFIKKNSKVFTLLCLLLVICLIKTIARNKDWESNYTLYSKDVKYSPKSAHIHYHYGLVLVKDKALKAANKNEQIKYLDLAIKEFRTAVNIFPAYANAYDQMGLGYFRKGDNEKAVENYELALKYNPGKAITYSNLGIIYFNTGNFQKALEVYQKAVELDPRFADAYMNLGSTYGTLGNFDLAIENFLKCLEYAPQNALVHYYLGLTYQSKGDSVNAKIYRDKAYFLEPSLRDR